MCTWKYICLIFHFHQLPSLLFPPSSPTLSVSHSLCLMPSSITHIHTRTHVIYTELAVNLCFYLWISPPASSPTLTQSPPHCSCQALALKRFKKLRSKTFNKWAACRVIPLIHNTDNKYTSQYFEIWALFSADKHSFWQTSMRVHVIQVLTGKFFYIAVSSI